MINVIDQRLVVGLRIEVRDEMLGLYTLVAVSIQTLMQRLRGRRKSSVSNIREEVRREQLTNMLFDSVRGEAHLNGGGCRWSSHDSLCM